MVYVDLEVFRFEVSSLAELAASGKGAGCFLARWHIVGVGRTLSACFTDDTGSCVSHWLHGIEIIYFDIFLRLILNQSCISRLLLFRTTMIDDFFELTTEIDGKCSFLNVSVVKIHLRFRLHLGNLRHLCRENFRVPYDGSMT